MNKKLVLFDNDIISEKSMIRKTRVQIIDHDTGQCLFNGRNKVVIQGSTFIAKKLFNIPAQVTYENYNNNLGLDNTDAINTENINETVCLFAAGNDGCGPLNSQVYPVEYTTGITNPLPFRYQKITGLNNGDLSEELRNKYFGRKKISDQRVAYYFKAFEVTPVIKQQRIDGTLITENVTINNDLEEIETFVRIQLSITKEDFRDYFINDKTSGGLSEAKVNTISLLTAYPVVKPDGYTYYQNIMPFTRINFPNEELFDTTKSLDIIYDVFE